MDNGFIEVTKNEDSYYCKCCSTRVEEGVYTIRLTLDNHTHIIELCKTHLTTLAIKSNSVLAKD